jgi:uncharacterized phage protein (TIGR01671 family)
MKREIEFRAWDKKAGEMFEVHELYFVDNSNTFGKGILDEHNDFHPMDEIKLLQSTGLLDKNGKKIFEGYILKIYYEGNQRSYLKEVKWLNDAINKGRWDALDTCVYTSCEVVGNIFENPELLEG